MRAACVPFGFQASSVDVAFPNLMSTPLGVESDIVDPLANARAGLKYSRHLSELDIIALPARTLNQVLLETRAPRSISLLSVDGEWGEIEVLKGIDFGYFAFNLVLVEARDFARIKSCMESKGCTFVVHFLYLDCLFRCRTWPVGSLARN